jgi:hydrogenase maturation protein HypF
MVSSPINPDNIRRVAVRVSGKVQGVGFRSFVHGAAIRLGLSGWVRNEGRYVSIEAEGHSRVIAEFLDHLQQSPPPVSRVDQVESIDIPTQGKSDFRIAPSSGAVS